MYIGRLHAAHFRNLDALEWWPHRHFNLVTGQNGQGKTNLLEAISVVTALRSFRTSRLADCVQFGHERATVAVQAERQGLRCDLALQFGSSARKLSVDGKAASGVSTYLGRLCAVLFTAADLQLPHDVPEARRKYLDRVVFNHEAAHLLDLRLYERVLTSRNTLLRQARTAPSDPGLIEVYDELLASHGARIIERRRAVLGRFAPVLAEVFERIAEPGLKASIRYQPRGAGLGDLQGAELVQALLDTLRAQRSRDLAMGHTTRGPHRDDVGLLIGGRPAHLHASQGQCRALVLALKIAEIRSLEASLGEPPILLLDDVSSELDAERNRALMTYLEELGGQVFLTTTDPRFIRVAAARQIFDMQAGILTPGPVLPAQEEP